MDPTLKGDIESGLESPDETERWDMACMLGQYVEDEPDEVWPFVERWGSSDVEDTRMAIASCVLEHLLEYHFDAIFPRVEARALADPRFADTFCGCWKFGLSEEPANSERFEALKTRLLTGGAP